MKKKLSNVNAQREAEAPSVAALESECASLEVMIQQLNEQQAVLQHKARMTKDQYVPLSTLLLPRNFSVCS